MPENAPALKAFSDEHWMARALQLAANGLFTTGVNPRVGCVLVRDHQLIGEGWHERAGEPHAEVMALRDAERRGNLTQGATAYVTLEPCSHFGKTPPCADALIQAGISRVVAAMKDPNPQVAGQGFSRLIASGIAVESKVMSSEAERLNVGFIKRMREGLPWIRLKMAGSIDGRSALANGASQWITSAQARADGHRLRARAQALVTGVGTVIADDPQLTVRGVTMPQTQTQGESVVSPMPLRVVVDSQLKTPVSARILQGGCLIATASKDVNKRNRLEAAGAEVVVLPNEQDRVDLKALMSHLAARGMNEVHVEAGSRLSGVFLQEGLIDEIVLYMAPCLLGSDARGFFDGLNLTTLTEKLVFNYQDIRMVGPDLRIIVTPSV